MSIEIEAEARVIAIDCGVISLKEIISWADAEILSHSDFDERLIDISLAKTIAEVVSALNTFGGSKSKDLVAEKVFGFMYRALVSENASYQKVAKKLFFMATDNYIPKEASDGEMWGFWDSLDLALDGIFGNPKEIQKSMLGFLVSKMS